MLESLPIAAVDRDLRVHVHATILCERALAEVSVRRDWACAGVAVSRNVSDTGMLMVAASRLAVGGSITVTFRVANVVPTQTVTGHIVRCEPNTESSGLWPYRIAVAFDEMHADLEEMMRVLETAQAPAATK